MKHPRARFWVEAGMASLTGSLAVLTLVWRDWIEGVFGFDPDHHNGSFEWGLVAVCLVATVALASLARREWQQTVPDSA
jgi:hypothetical protein